MFRAINHYIMNRQGHRWALVLLNSLLHWLFLNHDIIFLFLDHIEKKINFWILLKTLWKMEHLLQKSKCSNFHNIFIYIIFQRGQRISYEVNGKLHAPLTIFHDFFFSSAVFFKSTFSKKKSFRNTIWVSNRLDPDQALCSFEHHLGPICLQSLSADNTRVIEVISKANIKFLPAAFLSSDFFSKPIF